MAELTQKDVRRLFKYDPDTGILTNKIRRSSNSMKGCEVGSFDKRKYLVTQVSGNYYKVHRLIWLYVYGYMPENFIDHINRNPSDNRLCNLREVTQSCNMRNAKNREDNTSGVQGVHWQKNRKTWFAYITNRGRRHCLGNYKNLHNAVCARLAGEQCLEWDKCNKETSAYRYVKDNITL